MTDPYLLKVRMVFNKWIALLDVRKMGGLDKRIPDINCSAGRGFTGVRTLYLEAGVFQMTFRTPV